MASIDRPIPYTLNVIEALARQHRVLDDKDLRSALPRGVNANHRREALDLACGRWVLHARKDSSGLFDSMVYGR